MSNTLLYFLYFQALFIVLFEYQSFFLFGVCISFLFQILLGFKILILPYFGNKFLKVRCKCRTEVWGFFSFNFLLKITWILLKKKYSFSKVFCLEFFVKNHFNKIIKLIKIISFRLKLEKKLSVSRFEFSWYC